MRYSQAAPSSSGLRVFSYGDEHHHLKRRYGSDLSCDLRLQSWSATSAIPI